LDAAIQGVDQGHGVFIKLSNRSPKDASLNMTRTHDCIRELIRASDCSAMPEMVNEEVAIVNKACSESLQVRTGAAALRLLLESERVYVDLMQHRLFLEEAECFSLAIAVRQWCDDLNPDWEFRLFVMNGATTALTIYNDLHFDAVMLYNKSRIEGMILATWTDVKDDIHKHVDDYCIDFAITPDLQKIFIIEVNAFIPPIAGSGLFDYHEEADHQLLMHGPFSFRLRQEPLQSHEQSVAGGVRTLHPPLLALMRNERQRATKASSSCAVS
jgi:hypothetical protein